MKKLTRTKTIEWKKFGFLGDKKKGTPSIDAADEFTWLFALKNLIGVGTTDEEKTRSTMQILSDMFEKGSEAIWVDISLWFDDIKQIGATEEVKLYATERYIGNAK